MIVQYGGQTPLKLALDLEAQRRAHHRHLARRIDLAEDRERFQQLLHQLGLKQPPNRTARTEEAGARNWRRRSATRWWCARAMCWAAARWKSCTTTRNWSATCAKRCRCREESPVLLDRFLDDAIEVDVDCISDGTRRADRRHHGTHRAGRRALGRLGLLAAALHPVARRAGRMRRQTAQMAKALNVVGLMNAQFAIRATWTTRYMVYMLEVNPRASRTVPFVSKATGLPLAKIAARCMAGNSLAKQG